MRHDARGQGWPDARQGLDLGRERAVQVHDDRVQGAGCRVRGGRAGAIAARLRFAAPLAGGVDARQLLFKTGVHDPHGRSRRTGTPQPYDASRQRHDREKPERATFV